MWIKHCKKHLKFTEAVAAVRLSILILRRQRRKSWSAFWKNQFLGIRGSWEKRHFGRSVSFPSIVGTGAGRCPTASMTTMRSKRRTNTKLRQNHSAGYFCFHSPGLISSPIVSKMLCVRQLRSMSWMPNEMGIWEQRIDSLDKSQSSRRLCRRPSSAVRSPATADFSGRVVGVIDGDTIEVLHNNRAERDLPPFVTPRPTATHARQLPAGVWSAEEASGSCRRSARARSA
jgi:hypothetical protein